MHGACATCARNRLSRSSTRKKRRESNENERKLENDGNVQRSGQRPRLCPARQKWVEKSNQDGRTVVLLVRGLALAHARLLGPHGGRVQPQTAHPLGARVRFGGAAAPLAPPSAGAIHPGNNDCLGAVGTSTGDVSLT